MRLMFIAVEVLDFFYESRISAITFCTVCLSSSKSQCMLVNKPTIYKKLQKSLDASLNVL